MAIARHDSRISQEPDTLIHQSAVPRPYADVPTVALADTLEHQYDQGQPLDPDVIFEVLGRLLEAEGKAVPTNFVERLNL